MSLYRKKPVVIEARQLFLRNAEEIAEWCGGTFRPGDAEHPLHAVVIPTLEGDMRAHMYNYVIKGVQGEFYPCAEDIFEATYEPVEGGAS